MLSCTGITIWLVDDVFVPLPTELLLLLKLLAVVPPVIFLKNFVKDFTCVSLPVLSAMLSLLH